MAGKMQCELCRNNAAEHADNQTRIISAPPKRRRAVMLFISTNANHRARQPLIAKRGSPQPSIDALESGGVPAKLYRHGESSGMAMKIARASTRGDRGIASAYGKYQHELAAQSVRGATTIASAMRAPVSRQNTALDPKALAPVSTRGDGGRIRAGRVVRASHQIAAPRANDAATLNK